MALPPETELLETLGEGSFGRVFVARVAEGPLRRTVVLKVLKGEWAQHDEVLLRARDEAALLARLHHDNIVKVEQLTTLQGRPAVVMEHIQGLSLDRVLRAHGPLPVAVALEVCAKVASALDAAWQGVPPGETQPLRVIHRDIKPSNIILSVHGGVKVLDFGTARAHFDAREASTRSLTFGSAPYMAPECFDSVQPTPAVDVYALGATLYELVAGVALGKLSVNPREHSATLTQRLQALRPRELPEGGPLEALRELIAFMVRYEPTRRPSARLVRDQCRALRAGLPERPLRLDQFAEAVVEPLYRQRESTPPPLGSTSVLPPETSTLLPSGAHREPPAPAALAPATAARPDRGRPGGLLALAALLGVGALGGLTWALRGPPPPTADGLSAELAPRPPRPRRDTAAPAEEIAVPGAEGPGSEGPGPGGPGSTTRGTGSTRAARPTSSAPATRAPAPAALAQVKLGSLPAGATVRVGGRSYTCPTSSAELPLGRVEVEVEFTEPPLQGRCTLEVSAGGAYRFDARDGRLICP